MIARLAITVNRYYLYTKNVIIRLAAGSLNDRPPMPPPANGTPDCSHGGGVSITPIYFQLEFPIRIGTPKKGCYK